MHIECLEVASKKITKAWITNNLENQMKLTSSMHNFLWAMEWKTHELHNDHLTIEQMNYELFEFEENFNKHLNKLGLRCLKLKRTSMIICSTMEVLEVQENFNNHKWPLKFWENMLMLIPLEIKAQSIIDDLTDAFCRP